VGRPSAFEASRVVAVQEARQPAGMDSLCRSASPGRDPVEVRREHGFRDLRVVGGQRPQPAKEATQTEIGVGRDRTTAGDDKS
jgi:hypothetical protein